MRHALALLLLFALLSTLCACAAPPAPADLYGELRTLPLPPGVWYTASAAPFEREHLSDGLATVLLGAMTDGEGRPLYEDFCIFLSADGETVCELAVVSCYTSSAADALAEHLALRLSLLARSPAAAASLLGATVLRRADTVIYTLTPCNASVLAAVG